MDDQRESQSGFDGVVATGNNIGAEYINLARRFTSLWDGFQTPGKLHVHFPTSDFPGQRKLTISHLSSRSLRILLQRALSLSDDATSTTRIRLERVQTVGNVTVTVNGFP